MPTTSDTSLDLQRERFALRSLLDFAQTLTPELGVEGIIRSVLRTIMGKALIQDAFAYVHRGYFPEEMRGLLQSDYILVSQSGFRGIRFERGVDPHRLMHIGPDGSVLRVPIYNTDHTQTIALLGFGPSMFKDASLTEHSTFIESLAVLTSMALTNAQLFESEKQRERFEAELRLAREIQRSLFPQHFPVVPGLAFAGLVRPSGLVGGDYLDVIDLTDNRVLVCVADVVGKGISAALIMSNLQAALRTLVPGLRDKAITLAEIVDRLNQLIFEHTSAERFVTAVFGVIDTSSKSLEICVCGHPNPLIIRGLGSCEQISSKGIPLGILADYRYEPAFGSFAEGSTLILYTDGLSEARLPRRSEMLGQQGAEDLILREYAPKDPPDVFVERIIGSDGLHFDDDITILVVRFEGPSK